MTRRAAPKYKPYRKYKPSGIAWLGDVPRSWGVQRFKTLFAVSTEKNGSRIEGEMLSVSGYRGIEIKEYDDEGRKRADEDLVDYRVVRVGQLVVNTMWLNYAGLGVSEHEGYVSPAYRSYWVSDKLDGRYIHHLLRSVDYVAEYTKYMQGIRPNSLQIKTDDFVCFPVLVPPLPEQHTIAAFLGRETGKIDRLIGKQERMIDLLREKRQAVISRAVTKGLNPKVPMKDSGTEWLGEIPEHWAACSYRYVTRILRGKFGHRPRNDPSLYGGEYPFVQTGDVARANKYITDYSQTLNDKGAAVSAKFPAGTLVMAIAANVGNTAILGFEAYCPDSIVGFSPNKKMDLEYLRYSFISALHSLLSTATVSTQMNLNIDRIGSVSATIPPRTEQVAIAQFLNEATAKIDGLIFKAEQAIELMKERRAALISAAVTGKIDVSTALNAGVRKAG